MLGRAVRLLVSWALLVTVQRTLRLSSEHRRGDLGAEPLSSEAGSERTEPPAPVVTAPTPIDPGGEAAESRQERPRSLEVSDVPVLFAVLGLLSSGAATLSLTAFYAEFDVSLEEVGVGVPRVVVLGSVVALNLGGIAALGVLAGLGLATLFRRRLALGDPYVHWAFVAGAASVAMWVLLLPPLASEGWWTDLLAALAVVAGVGTLLLPFATAQLYGHKGLALAPLAVTAYLGLWVWAATWASSDVSAQRLRSGEEQCLKPVDGLGRGVPSRGFG